MASAVLRTRAIGSLVPATIGFSSGILLLQRRQPYRLDALPAVTGSNHYGEAGYKKSSREPPLADRLDPNVIKQISGGSLSGEQLRP